VEARTVAGPKKKAEEEGHTLLFVDEAGYYLLPMAVRTYALVGKTPILRVPLTQDPLSVMGAVSTRGRLFFPAQTRGYTSTDVVRFLRLLLRKVPGKLLLIWDGALLHRSQAIKDFLARGAAKRLHLERLPAYAPDLNPQEGIGNLLKRRELKNVCWRDLAELSCEFQWAKGRLHHRRASILACFAHADCPL
jgi:transposase